MGIGLFELLILAGIALFLIGAVIGCVLLVRILTKSS